MFSKENVIFPGKTIAREGSFPDSNIGCVYISPNGGWSQVMRKDADPVCNDAHTSNKERLCVCKKSSIIIKYTFIPPPLHTNR